MAARTPDRLNIRPLTAKKAAHRFTTVRRFDCLLGANNPFFMSITYWIVPVEIGIFFPGAGETLYIIRFAYRVNVFSAHYKRKVKHCQVD